MLRHYYCWLLYVIRKEIIQASYTWIEFFYSQIIVSIQPFSSLLLDISFIHISFLSHWISHSYTSSCHGISHSYTSSSLALCILMLLVYSSTTCRMTNHVYGSIKECYVSMASLSHLLLLLCIIHKIVWAYRSLFTCFKAEIAF